VIYEDQDFRIEWEESEIPWVKIFAKANYKEITDMPKALRQRLWELGEIVEITMRELFTPDKINIASFGNYVPQVHLHVMARFATDSFFPEPMWGTRQREGSYQLKEEQKRYFERCLVDKIKL